MKYLNLFILALSLSISSCSSVKKDELFEDSSIVVSSYQLDYQDLYYYQKMDESRASIYDKTEAYSIRYLSEGLKIHGYLAKPKQIDKPLPLVVYCRGGNRDFGEITDEGALSLAGMASNGYVVLASNYGGSKQSEGVDEFGGKEVKDVINLLDLAKDFPFIDTTNILFFGESRGGLMVYQALKEQRENKNIRAAVLLASPTDLELVFRNRPEMEGLVRVLVPNYSNEKESAIQMRSVLNWVEELPKHVPILLLHGVADKRVSVEHSIKLAEQLKALNHPHKLKIYKGGYHSFSSFRDSVIIERETWFNKYIEK
jgi:dipeptidyl aminopeptidase/acylaminoacyl peptidase